MKIFIYINIIKYKVDINLMRIKMTDRKNREDISDGICEVFDSHGDVIERVQKRMIDENQYSELSEFFKIFGNPTRLKILSLLAIEDLCVCDICEALNLNQTTVSNQLRILRANNIVKYQKEGKMARYSLTDLHIEMIYKVGLEHILE